jgi:multiple sugar transport system permease protein
MPMSSRWRNLSSGRRRPARPAGARREEKAAYLFLLPWLLGLLFFVLGPILLSLFLSFTDYSIISKTHLIGLSNYKALPGDYNFRNAVWITFKYIILSVPIYMVVGLALSLLLNLRIKGMYLFRTILFLPSVLSGVAVAILWVTLLNPDVGAVNWVLRHLGMSDPPRWLASPEWAVPSVVLIGLWSVGGGAIIYLAGLQNIPAQLYEAVSLDGAGFWGRFRYVTLPLLTPTLLFVILTGLIDAFQVFDVAYVLQGAQGSTGSSLNFYLVNLYNEAFRAGQFGYASALAWVMVIVAAIAILLLFRTSARWVYYESEDGRPR